MCDSPQLHTWPRCELPFSTATRAAAPELADRGCPLLIFMEDTPQNCTICLEVCWDHRIMGVFPVGSVGSFNEQIDFRSLQSRLSFQLRPRLEQGLLRTHTPRPHPRTHPRTHPPRTSHTLTTLLTPPHTTPSPQPHPHSTPIPHLTTPSQPHTLTHALTETHVLYFQIGKNPANQKSGGPENYSKADPTKAWGEGVGWGVGERGLGLGDGV